MIEDTFIVPWRLAWRAKGAAVQVAVLPLGLVALLYVGYDCIAGILHLPEGVWLVLCETLFTVLEALLITTLLEGPLAGPASGDRRPHWLPSRRAFGFALAFVPPGIVLSLLHVFLRWSLIGPLGIVAGPPPALWEVVLFFHPMQWAVLGLAVAPLAQRLLRLPPLPATSPSGTRLSATAIRVGMVLVAALLASGVAMGLYAVLPSPGSVAGAFPSFGATSIAGQASAVVCWYAPAYVVTLLIAATIAVLPAKT